MSCQLPLRHQAPGGHGAHPLYTASVPSSSTSAAAVLGAPGPARPCPGTCAALSAHTVSPRHHASSSHVLGVAARQPFAGHLVPAGVPVPPPPPSVLCVPLLTTVFYLSRPPDPHWTESAPCARPLRPGPWRVPETLRVSKGASESHRGECHGLWPCWQENVVRQSKETKLRVTR